GELHKKLAAYDAAFLSRITVRGFFHMSSAQSKAELRLTCAGRNCAIQEISSFRPPYIKPNDKSGKKQRYGYDKNGNAHFIKDRRKVLYLFNDDKCAKMETATEYVIAPDGKIVSQRDHNH